MRYINRPAHQPANYEVLISNQDQDNGDLHLAGHYKDLLDKTPLKYELAALQQFYCAVCGDILPIDESGEHPRVIGTIEHVQTQYEAQALSLAYNNLVACCNRDYCCNIGRGNQPIGEPFYFNQASITSADRANPYFEIEISDGLFNGLTDDATQFVNGYKLNHQTIRVNRLDYVQDLILQVRDEYPDLTTRTMIAKAILQREDVRFKEFVFQWVKAWAGI